MQHGLNIRVEFNMRVEFNIRLESNYKGVSVCPSIFSTTVDPINFTLGGCIAEDPRKRRVECEVVWMSVSREARSEQARNGHCTGGCVAEDPRKCSVECEVFWMSGSRESCKQQYWRPSTRPAPNSHVLNGHCTSLVYIYSGF